MCYLKMALRGLYCLVLSGLLSCSAPNDKAASPQEPKPATFQQPAPAIDRASAVADVVVERDSLPPKTWKQLQKKIFERIRYEAHYGYENYRIEFWNKESKKLSKQIMLMDLDPFAELRQLPNTTKDIGDSNGFELSKVGQEKLRQYMQAKGYPQWLIEKEITSALWGIQADYESIDKKNIAFVYYLMLYSPSGKAITKLAEYRVYDEKGNEVGNFSDYRGGSSPAASRDGKWMAVGIEEFDEDTDIDDMGQFSTLIYEVASGQPIYQDQTMSFNLFAIHDYIVNRDQTLYNFFFPEKKIKYTKTFDFRIWPAAMDDYEPDGVYASTYVSLESIRVARKRLYFEKDFEVSPLKRIEQ